MPKERKETGDEVEQTNSTVAKGNEAEAATPADNATTNTETSEEDTEVLAGDTEATQAFAGDVEATQAYDIQDYVSGSSDEDEVDLLPDLPPLSPVVTDVSPVTDTHDSPSQFVELTSPSDQVIVKFLFLLHNSLHACIAHLIASLMSFQLLMVSTNVCIYQLLEI